MNIAALILIIVGWLLISFAYYSWKRLNWVTENSFRILDLIYCYNIIKIVFDKYEERIEANSFLPVYERCLLTITVNNFEDFVSDKNTLNKLNLIEKKLNYDLKTFAKQVQDFTDKKSENGIVDYVKGIFPEGI